VFVIFNNRCNWCGDGLVILPHLMSGISFSVVIPNVLLTTESGLPVILALIGTWISCGNPDT
jgi:hypothetical protein